MDESNRRAFMPSTLFPGTGTSIADPCQLKKNIKNSHSDPKKNIIAGGDGLHDGLYAGFGADDVLDVLAYSNAESPPRETVMRYHGINKIVRE